MKGSIIMEITIFAKKRVTKDNKPFAVYLTSLKRKDGTELKVSVGFTSQTHMPNPDECPINIVVDKKDANLATSTYEDVETGELKTKHKLWVSKWERGGEYVDHSLDDFE